MANTLVIPDVNTFVPYGTLDDYFKYQDADVPGSQYFQVTPSQSFPQYVPFPQQPDFPITPISPPPIPSACAFCTLFYLTQDFGWTAGQSGPCPPTLGWHYPDGTVHSLTEFADAVLNGEPVGSLGGIICAGPQGYEQAFGGECDPDFEIPIAWVAYCQSLEIVVATSGIFATIPDPIIVIPPPPPPNFCQPPGQLVSTPFGQVCQYDPPMPNHLPFAFRNSRSIKRQKLLTSQTSRKRIVVPNLALNPTINAGKPFHFKPCGCDGPDFEEKI
jgi:hypothetical protein